MSTVTKAQIAAALTQRFMDRIASTINRTVLMAQIAPVKSDRGQGQNVQWDAKFGEDEGTPIADGADVTVFNNDDKVPAVLQYAIHHDAFRLTGLARAVAAAAGNPAALADLWMDSLNDSVERQAKGISRQLYLGDGSTGPQKLHGLVPAVGVAAIGDTGVYATIDRAARAAWQANVIDATAFDAGNPTGRFNLTIAGEPAPEGIKMMRAASRAIYESSSEPYDVIVTSPILHEAYGLAIHAERRWVDQIRTANGPVKLDQGYQMLEFDGKMMIQDVDCPADEMLFLNTRHMHIQQLPDRVDRVNSAMAMTPVAGTEDEFLGSGRTKLQARIQPLSINGDAFPFALYSYLQLCVKSPNRFARISKMIP
jgi:hypothetical protein